VEEDGVAQFDAIQLYHIAMYREEEFALLKEYANTVANKFVTPLPRQNVSKKIPILLCMNFKAAHRKLAQLHKLQHKAHNKQTWRGMIRYMPLQVFSCNY
jgi:hypothetical protein